MTTTTPKQPKATSKGSSHTTTTTNPAGSLDRELTRPSLAALLAGFKTPDGKPKYGMIQDKPVIHISAPDEPPFDTPTATPTSDVTTS